MKYFTRPVEINDWKRFLENTRRVRHIIDPASIYYPTVSRAALQEILSTRPNAQIFPNLRSMRGLPLMYSYEPMFMSDTVVEIRLAFRRHQESPSVAALHRRVLLIIERMPNIERLFLEADSPLGELEDDICLLISSLSMLTELTLPVFCLSPAIIHATAGLTRLKKLDVSRETLDLYDSASTTQSYRLAADIEDSYPSLRSLAFAATMNGVTTLMKQSNLPTFLTTLEFHMMAVKSNPTTSLPKLLKAIGVTLPSLEKLKLWLIPVGHKESDAANQKFLPFGFKDFSSVSRFPRLTSFTIRAIHPLDITEEELRGLIAEWPTLEELDLNKKPVVQSRSSLPLKSLLHFTPCRNLRSLGLYLRIEHDEIPPVSIDPKRTTIFPQIAVDIGSSPCTVNRNEPLFFNKVALFFADILKDPLSLKWDSARPRKCADYERDPDYGGKLVMGYPLHSAQSIVASFRMIVKERVEQDILRRELANIQRDHVSDLRRAQEQVESLRQQLREVQTNNSQ